jgi:hypothetical protein
MDHREQPVQEIRALAQGEGVASKDTRPNLIEIADLHMSIV